jgi:hypothetical protein
LPKHPGSSTANALSSMLAGAAMIIDSQFGDWAGEPLTDASPEIITIARRG